MKNNLILGFGLLVMQMGFGMSALASQDLTKVTGIKFNVDVNESATVQNGHFLREGNPRKDGPYCTIDFRSADALGSKKFEAGKTYSVFTPTITNGNVYFDLKSTARTELANRVICVSTEVDYGNGQVLVPYSPPITSEMIEQAFDGVATLIYSSEQK